MNKSIQVSALLGCLTATLLATQAAEAGGWFKRATGFRTPEPIRKIAPNGIQFPKVGHGPTSNVTPNSVFNYQPAAPMPQPKPNYTPPQNNQWLQQQQINQLQFQQRQFELQQQQLRYQQEIARSQQKAQVIGTIFQGIGSLLPQRDSDSFYDEDDDDY